MLHGLTAFFLHLVDLYGYAGLFAAMTLANIGAPVGSELVLPAAGALAATGHLGSVWLAIVIAICAELTGQTIAYAVGRFGGRPLVERFGPYVRFHHTEMVRAERFFARYGSFAIFICRFIPVVRGVVGIPAGIAEMPLAHFYLWTLCGSSIFCGGLVLLGAALGQHADVVVATIRKFALLIIALAIVAASVFALIQHRLRRRAAARGEV